MVQDRGMAVTVGQDVYTRDGDHLGKVKEVRGDRFKIDASMQADYWLPTSSAGQPLGNDLTVTFTKDQLSEYKSDAPADGDGPSGADRAGGMTEEEKRAVSGYEPTTVPYRTGFTAALQDQEWHEAEPAFRQDWEGRDAAAGQRWEEAAPGYRYAHSMSRDARYQDRDWEAIERELEADYPAWSREEGYPQEQQDWNRSRGATREAWLLIWRPR